jgi:hypothetical protein
VRKALLFCALVLSATVTFTSSHAQGINIDLSTIMAWIQLGTAKNTCEFCDTQVLDNKAKNACHVSCKLAADTGANIKGALCLLQPPAEPAACLACLKFYQVTEDVRSGVPFVSCYNACSRKACH